MSFLFQAFPCLYVMATERSQKIYGHIFQSLEDDFKLNTSEAWIDYELALRDAIMICYPRVILKAFWYQFCLAVRRKCKTVPYLYESVWSKSLSSLFHQFLCLPLLQANEIFEGINILKRKEDADVMNPVAKILDSFIRREGVENICVNWENFGKQCSENHNENLKKKFLNSDSSTSFYYLMKLMMDEQIKIERAYVSDERKEIISPLNMTIKNAKEDLLKGKIDVTTFLDRLTFSDNSYHVKDLDVYEIGDEGECFNDEQEEAIASQRVNGASQQTRNDDNCAVCLTAKRDTIVEPCNHLRFCYGCIEKLHESTRRRTRRRNDVKPSCPICRKPIDSYKRVFL